VTLPAAGSALGSDAVVGYRAFLAVVVAAYCTLIALTPRAAWMPDVLWALLVPLSALYLALGIWGFDYARRRSGLLISLGYVLIEFAIGIASTLSPGVAACPLILLPLAAQAVIAAAPISTTHVVGSPAPAHRPASRG
jgi:hypothetical protein